MSSEEKSVFNDQRLKYKKIDVVASETTGWNVKTNNYTVSFLNTKRNNCPAESVSVNCLCLH